MNRAGSFRRYVTGNSVRPGELTKEPLQSIPVALDRRIAFGVRPLEIGHRYDARATMTWTDDIHHVQIVLFDEPVKVDIKKIQSGRSAPMPEQARLDMFELERGLEQRIVF